MVYFIRNNKWDLMDFLWSGIDQHYEIIDLPPLKTNAWNNFFCKVAHLFWSIHIYLKWHYFEDSIYLKVKSFNSGDHVIFVGYFSRAILNIVPFIPSGVKVHVTFWDSISNLSDFRQLMPYVKALKVDLVSYDKIDCHSYGMRFVPQYYNFCHFPHLQCNLNEAYFMCSNIDDYRLNQLKTIVLAIEKLGLSTKQLLVNNVSCKWISYKENLQNVCNCSVLIELNKSGQYGLTMRTMESIALKKKLITNNPKIREYPFYNSHNIFIFGIDDMSELPSFFKLEYEPVSPEIIREYDVNNWLFKVLNDNQK